MFCTICDVCTFITDSTEHVVFAASFVVITRNIISPAFRVSVRLSYGPALAVISLA